MTVVKGTWCPCRTALPPGTTITARFPKFCLPVTKQNKKRKISCHSGGGEEKKSDLSGGRSHRGKGQLTVQGSGLGSRTQGICTTWSWYGLEKGEILCIPPTALHSPMDSHPPLPCLPDQNTLFVPVPLLDTLLTLSETLLTSKLLIQLSSCKFPWQTFTCEIS